MTWREHLLLHLGAGYFSGVTLGDWLSLLKENRFDVSPSCWLRALSTLAQSVPNTVLRWWETRRFEDAWNAVAVRPPLFVLGHYRQGTTHLHNLLSVDRRFAFPNMYQTTYPHSFLTMERLNAKLLNFFIPRRRPFDNVRMGATLANEDEIAMVPAACVSPYLSHVFPRRAEHYDRLLTFRDASEAELNRWRDGLMLFFKKLTLKYDKPLIVKSPPHTARIRLLLEMFPDARFVHIHRDPSVVYRSTQRLVASASQWVRLQSYRDVDRDARIISGYREMYDAFFEERGLIPAGHFHEIRFENLEADPVGELRTMYETLALPDFSETEEALRSYVATIATYKKNRFPPLTGAEAERVRTEWRRSFDAWGYRPPAV